MNDCPTTPEQLMQVAWRVDNDDRFVEHVAQCDSCAAQVEQWRAVPEQVHNEIASSERIAAVRKQLLDSITAASNDTGNEQHSPAAADVSREGTNGIAPAAHPSSVRKIGVFLMRHHRSLTALTALAVLATVFVTAPGSTEGLAQETARAIRQAKSVRFRVTHSVALKLGGTEQQFEMLGQGYWKADGSHRMDMEQKGQLEHVSISFRNKSGLSIDHRQKSYRTTGPQAGQQSPLMKIINLASYSGDADRELGDREIEGVKSSGFEIAMNKVDDAMGDAMMEVWVSKKTHLPVRVTYNMTFSGQTMSMVMHQFEWDAKLDDALFDASPPAGYIDNTPTPPDAATQVAAIVPALKLYAELHDGHYPRGSTVYGDVTISQVSDKLGFSGLTPAEQSLKDRFDDFAKARRGYAMLNVLLRDNPNAEWNGKTVSALDTNKVLLSWQTADGFQVLFGDLSTKSVRTQAELKKLEGN